MIAAASITTAAACRSRAPGPPPLTVVIVVDQLRGDEIGTYEPLWRHGLRRLLDEGRWYSRAMLPYGRTETAAGHASLATGVTPRLHGIVDKVFFDATRGAILAACAPDPSGCGPGHLEVPTLGDRLKQAHPAARVVALAAKPRSATLLGGRQADLVMWIEPGRGTVSGRQAGRTAVPLWLVRYFEQVAGHDRIAHLWELPRLPEPFASRVDDAPDEMDPGHGTVFPHRLSADGTQEDRYWGWFCTPDADRAIVDTAAQLIRRLGLGTGAGPDLLLVSLGAFDSIGHVFGPDSLERVAALVELDRQLGDLLDAARAAAGRRAVVAVTSDHGVAPTLTNARQQGHASGRVDTQELARIVEQSLGESFGPGPHVAAALLPFITLHRGRDRSAAAETAARALAEHPSVRYAWPKAAMAGSDNPTARLMYESAHPSRSGDIAVVLEPYHATRTRWRGEMGAEHGTPWEYDRHIPLLVWGDGIGAGVIGSTVSITDLTRTLGDRLGLEPVANGGNPLP